ncbi:MAG: PASTA domain-containing protein, partial [Acidimicrobiales bacterium]
LEEATAALEQLTLTPDVSEGYDDAVEKGRIISQGLPAGEPARNGTAVPIVVSQGREPVEIQDFTGRALVDAERYLTDAGFKVVVNEKASDDVAPGVVLSQEPRNGTGYRGDEVRLEVSVGPEAIPVPNVTGMRLRDAKNTLEDAGFRVDVQRGLPGWGDQEERTVWRQNPSSGNLPPKSTITIWVI